MIIETQRPGLLDRFGVETVSQGMAGFSFEHLIPLSILEIDGLVLNQPLLTVPLEVGKGTTAVASPSNCGIYLKNMPARATGQIISDFHMKALHSAQHRTQTVDRSQKK